MSITPEIVVPESSQQLAQQGKLQVMQTTLESFPAVPQPTGKTLDTFHPFKKLPTELRLAIWNFAIPNNRVLVVSEAETPTAVQTIKQPKIPAILHSSQESRKEALRQYTFRMNSYSHQKVCFNPYQDIILFHSTDGLKCSDILVPLGPIDGFSYLFNHKTDDWESSTNFAQTIRHIAIQKKIEIPKIKIDSSICGLEGLKTVTFSTTGPSKKEPDSKLRIRQQLNWSMSYHKEEVARFESKIAGAQLKLGERAMARFDHILEIAAVIRSVEEQDSKKATLSTDVEFLDEVEFKEKFGLE